MRIQEFSCETAHDYGPKTYKIVAYLDAINEKPIIDKIVNGSLGQYVEIALPKAEPMKQNINYNPCAEVILPIMDPRISSEIGKKLAKEYDKRWVEKYKSTLSPTQFDKEYKAEFLMEDKVRQAPMPHSLRVGELNGKYMNGDVVTVQGYGIAGKAEVRDEQVRVTFNVPGIEPDQLKVQRINDTIRITKLKNNGEEDYDPFQQSVTHATYYLADNETIEDVFLDLGVLTIIIDRNAEVEEYSL